MARTLTIELGDKDYAVAITRAQLVGLPVERYPPLLPSFTATRKATALSERIDMRLRSRLAALPCGFFDHPIRQQNDRVAYLVVRLLITQIELWLHIALDVSLDTVHEHL